MQDDSIGTTKPDKKNFKETLRYLSMLIEYDPITGKFSKNNICSTFEYKGSSFIRIRGDRYSSALLAWWFVRKEEPNGKVKLIDKDAVNKYAISNLYVKPYKVENNIKRIANKVKYTLLEERVRKLEEKLQALTEGATFNDLI